MLNTSNHNWTDSYAFSGRILCYVHGCIAAFGLLDRAILHIFLWVLENQVYACMSIAHVLLVSSVFPCFIVCEQMTISQLLTTNSFHNCQPIPLSLFMLVWFLWKCTINGICIKISIVICELTRETSDCGKGLSMKPKMGDALLF